MPSSRSPDGPRLALDAGVDRVIQPGGSKRDEDVIAAVERAGAGDGLHRPPALPALMDVRDLRVRNEVYAAFVRNGVGRARRPAVALGRAPEGRRVPALHEAHALVQPGSAEIGC